MNEGVMMHTCRDGGSSIIVTAVLSHRRRRWRWHDGRSGSRINNVTVLSLDYCSGAGCSVSGTSVAAV
ncbi:MAG: hypothetical protein GY874_05920 [Desulfobacteraceae bacterium]|nr:hypothetical protein [Desulfobacteraceae bacterium]